MKLPKSKLKECYYWECEDFYDKLPSKIEVPEYRTEIFQKTMTHNEILKEYNIVPYTMEQAFGVTIDIIPTLKPDWKGRLIYFKENEILYRLNAFRSGDGQLKVYVYEVDDSDEWGAGSGACLSNKPLESQSSDTLTLESLKLEVENLKNWAKSIGYK